ncbi:MAG: PepSY domain-containing protein [Pseudomonadota bacterium]
MLNFIKKQIYRVSVLKRNVFYAFFISYAFVFNQVILAKPYVMEERLSKRLDVTQYQWASNDLISKDQAAKIAVGAVKGKVMSITLSKNSSQPMYRVRILQSGKVITVKVDAKTGSVL